MFDISQLVIERNIPIPKATRTHHKGGLTLKDFVTTMAIDESVLIPRTQKAICSTLNRIAKETGMKFVTRKQEDPKQTRVWRTA